MTTVYKRAARRLTLRNSLGEGCSYLISQVLKNTERQLNIYKQGTVSEEKGMQALFMKQDYYQPVLILLY